MAPDQCCEILMNQSFPKPVDHPLSVKDLWHHHPIPVLAVIGDDATRITSIAHPRDAAAGSIAFIARADDDAQRLITASQASVLVMKVDADPRPGQCYLKVDDPHLWYIAALGLLFAPRTAPMIDSSARIAATARVGRNCRIGAFSVVEAGCKIGDHVEIGDHVTIKQGSQIGNDCVIQHHVTIGSEGVAFHRAADDSWHFFPHHGIAWIGDGVAIGSHCVIVRGMLQNTVVGSGCKLGNYVNVAHNCEIGENCWISSKVLLCGGVRLEPDVRLASAVSISSYVQVGRAARIGLGSVVTKDVPHGASMFGNPAKPLRTMRSF